MRERKKTEKKEPEFFLCAVNDFVVFSLITGAAPPFKHNPPISLEVNCDLAGNVK